MSWDAKEFCFKIEKESARIKTRPICTMHNIRNIIFAAVWNHFHIFVYFSGSGEWNPGCVCFVLWRDWEINSIFLFRFTCEQYDAAIFDLIYNFFLLLFSVFPVSAQIVYRIWAQLWTSDCIFNQKKIVEAYNTKKLLK